MVVRMLDLSNLVFYFEFSYFCIKYRIYVEENTKSLPCHINGIHHINAFL